MMNAECQMGMELANIPQLSHPNYHYHVIINAACEMRSAKC